MEFPSTPVIYVNKGGLYQCIVKFKEKEIKGKLVTVRVDVGMLCDYTAEVLFN